jgi:rare lipoprotein A
LFVSIFNPHLYIANIRFQTILNYYEAFPMQKLIMVFSLTMFVGFIMPVEDTLAAKQCGGASWYNMPGNKTASGERMNPKAMTAAHRKFRFGTKVRVTNRRNGRSVIVRINDRGPFIKGRVIDLSKAAAGKLGYLSRGHTSVCIERVG